MISDYLWVVIAVLAILIVLYYILGLLLPAMTPTGTRQEIKQKFGSASPGTFDQLGARNVQDRYQLVM